LGRRSLFRNIVYADPAPYQLRHHATVSDAFFQMNGEMMNTRRITLLLLLGCLLAPISEAQIKHIEMRVEGMT
jgi:hypothetical protein